MDLPEQSESKWDINCDGYYLYCDNGKQSSEISNRLNLFGYNTTNIVGGYEEYLNHKYY